jgi:hypothetical protein
MIEYTQLKGFLKAKVRNANRRPCNEYVKLNRKYARHPY